MATATAAAVQTFKCPECHKPLIVASIALKPGEWVQAHCKWCKRERRFEGNARN